MYDNIYIYNIYIYGFCLVYLEPDLLTFSNAQYSDNYSNSATK